MAEHGDVVRREFERQAPGFAQADSFFARGDIVGWIGALLPLQPSDYVLDVCGGAGHLSRGLADRAEHFTVLDLTTALLDTGQAFGAENVEFVEGDAAAMPFEDDLFDLAMCRFAFHHLPDQEAVVREMARVVRPGGYLAVIDMIAGGERHDELEILRDPSHTAAPTEDGLRAMFERVGAEVVADDLREQVLPADRWLAQSRPEPEAARTVWTALEAEAAGGEPTGLDAHRGVDNALMIAQQWLVLVAQLTR